MLLSSKRCPYTGVMNFYSVLDPHISVGSIARRRVDGFTWRSHAGGAELSGRAPDAASAERQLTNFLVSIDEFDGVQPRERTLAS